jgi:hypothetical protein
LRHIELMKYQLNIELFSKTTHLWSFHFNQSFYGLTNMSVSRNISQKWGSVGIFFFASRTSPLPNKYFLLTFLISWLSYKPIYAAVKFCKLLIKRMNLRIIREKRIRNYGYPKLHTLSTMVISIEFKILHVEN